MGGIFLGKKNQDFQQVMPLDIKPAVDQVIEPTFLLSRGLLQNTDLRYSEERSDEE